jgi:hypothetical protein
MTSTGFPRKLTTAQAAKILGAKKATLDWWRWAGQGPTYLKLSGKIYYLEADLEDFVRSCRRVPARRRTADVA